MRKAPRTGLWAFLATTLIVTGGSVWLVTSTGSKASHELDATKAEARRIGMPLELSDLVIPHAPRDTNAAQVYRQIDLIVRNEPTKARKALDKAADSRSSAQEQNLADQAIPQLKEEFALLDSLDLYPHCSFDRNWSLGANILLTEYAGMKRDVRDLALRADLQDRQGDSAGALKSLKIAYRISNDAGSEPILISMLVQVAGRNALGSTLEKLISRHTADPAFLKSVHHLLNVERVMPDFRNHLSYEIVGARRALRQMNGLQFSVQSSSADDSGAATAKGPNLLEKLLFNTSIAKNQADNGMTDMWLSAWKSMPQKQEDWQGFDRALIQLDRSFANDQRPWSDFTDVLFPVFAQSGEAVGRMIAQERLLSDSVELLQIQNKTGNLPAQLPSSLGADAIDPFDGNPLRYRPNGKSFVLYSIGSDRVDNGGKKGTPRDTHGQQYDQVVEFSGSTRI